MTIDWSVSRHMTPRKKRYRLEARDLVLKAWVILKIECTNRMCLRCSLSLDGRQPVCNGDYLEALLERYDASKKKQQL